MILNIPRCLRDIFQKVLESSNLSILLFLEVVSFKPRHRADGVTFLAVVTLA